MEKPPKGWMPPPKMDEPQAERQPAEKESEKQLPESPTPAASKGTDSENEDQRTPPPFDMLDIPSAMKKMGFNVAAALAQRWFDGREYVLSDDPKAEYPADMVDTTDVSLSFVLGYKKVEAKYEDLINDKIYSAAAKRIIEQSILSIIEKKFLTEGVAFTGDIDTFALAGRNVQNLHRNFQFQMVKISNLDTLDSSFGLTDLTAALANFFLMAAIANASVRSEKYYNYETGTPIYCCKSIVEVTHIYVYAKDSYSFADKTGATSSQYLGHWNKYGVVLVPAATASDVLNNVSEKGSMPFPVEIDFSADVTIGGSIAVS